MQPANTMLPPAICLTGGIATGKTRLSGWFASHGWKVISADVIVHDLYQPGQSLTAKIAECFGPGVLTAKGAIDRHQLAGKVFSNPDAMLTLNRMVHPLVRGIWMQKLAEFRADHFKTMVEIPLAYETDAPREFTATWVAACTPKEQRRRLTERSLSPEEVDERLKSQIPLHKKIDLADKVIWTNGPWKWTEKQLELLNENPT